jgi:lipopolysaccharide/colanic/teichoic acid biosynthesis glycosyltransferase
MSVYQRYGKRILDIIGAVILIVLTLPLQAVIILLLLVMQRGQVFFFQYRPGRYAQLFMIYKFKTMTDLKDKNGELLPDNERITWLGRWLRKTSLDELPQLYNVLYGQMSLIGPRPLLAAYLPHYNVRQQLRHQVRPGITGWAQINGRNALDWQTRLEMDAWYAENISLKLDIYILCRTLQLVFWTTGIYSDANKEEVVPFVQHSVSSNHFSEQ